MAKTKRSRKAKSPEQVQAEADQLKRESLMASGIPAHRVEGAKVHDFKQETFADLKERRKVIRLVFTNSIDRWLAEGGPGFEEPQRRAAKHMRGLWAQLSSPRLCANYGGMSFGVSDREDYLVAIHQVREYEKDIPYSYWLAFERLLREGWSAADAGAHLARTPAQQQAHAKAAAGFCLSLIAMWRGF